LYEEVVHKEENLHDTQVKDVMIVSPRTADLAILQNQFAEIGRATADLNLDRCLRLLHLIVPCYRASIPHDSTDRAHFPTIAEANKAD
jgi:FlaA1/EpsC-like NDP-sugar epimerase